MIEAFTIDHITPHNIPYTVWIIFRYSLILTFLLEKGESLHEAFDIIVIEVDDLLFAVEEGALHLTSTVDD